MKDSEGRRALDFAAMFANIAVRKILEAEDRTSLDLFEGSELGELESGVSCDGCNFGRSADNVIQPGTDYFPRRCVHSVVKKLFSIATLVMTLTFISDALLIEMSYMIIRTMNLIHFPKYPLQR